LRYELLINIKSDCNRDIYIIVMKGQCCLWCLSRWNIQAFKMLHLTALLISTLGDVTTSMFLILP